MKLCVIICNILNAIFDGDWINKIVIFLFGISTILAVLDFLGFLPPKIRDKIHLNRSDDTIATLEKLGVDTNRIKRLNESHKYPKIYDDIDEIKNIVNKELEKNVINEKVAVGRYQLVNLDKYYDLIGATTDPSAAEYFANILVSFWSIQIEKDDHLQDFSFDFVVTPKGGSPLLGYEFAKIVKKPFVLHEDSERFKGLSADMRSVFDCKTIPEKGSTALIVDDSTTGGRQVSNLIDDLQRFNYKTSVCLVIFEPKSKNAREILKGRNVELLSIVKTHDNNSNH